MVIIHRRPRRQYIGSRSGLKGVIECPKLSQRKWKAYLRHHGMYVTIGYFETKEEAAEAFNRESKRLFGKDAYLNSIPPTS